MGAISSTISRAQTAHTSTTLALISKKSSLATRSDLAMSPSNSSTKRDWARRRNNPNRIPSCHREPRRNKASPWRHKEAWRVIAPCLPQCQGSACQNSMRPCSKSRNTDRIPICEASACARSLRTAPIARRCPISQSSTTKWPKSPPSKSLHRRAMRCRRRRRP